MAATPSVMVALGTEASYFRLPDVVSGNLVSLPELKGELGTVIMFICNHCPYVVMLNHELVNVAREFTGRGIRFVAISSNDVVQYPKDGPEQMKEIASKRLSVPLSL